MEAPERLQHEVEQLLYHEAQLLDTGQFSAWLDLLADDIVYHAPVRVTRERGQQPDFSLEMEHFWDDRETLNLRVERLKTEFAWAEDPPSRTRHFVSNVRIAPGADPGEFDVASYLLVYRNRGEEATADLISAQRQDVWRRVEQPGGERAWRLCRRQILFDQATLGTKNLAIFF